MPKTAMTDREAMRRFTRRMIELNFDATAQPWANAVMRYANADKEGSE